MEQNQYRFKKGIQLAMTLAVCIWLLHQIQESSSSTQPIKEDGILLLGRKWKVVEGNEDGYYDQSEMGGGGNGILGFQDQNGIPADGFELVNSIPLEGRQYDQTQDLDYYNQ